MEKFKVILLFFSLSIVASCKPETKGDVTYFNKVDGKIKTIFITLGYSELVKTGGLDLKEEYPDLGSIIINTTGLYTVHPETFEKTPNLKKINFSRNHFQNEMSLDGIDKLKALHYLDLSYNHFIVIPPSLTNCRSLDTLDVSNNKLVAVDSGIAKLNNLRYLNLSNNFIQSLPDSINKLTQLESLILRNNKLKKFPSSLGSLKKLKELDLSGNNFEEIPPSLLELINLKRLVLSNNNLHLTEEQKNLFKDKLPATDIVYN